MARKFQLSLLKKHVSCNLCGGYLINATTITSCLHTFCKSCLAKYLTNQASCPDCRTRIAKDDPSVIRFDPILQKIINSLIPELQQVEIDRESAFYAQQEKETSPGEISLKLSTLSEKDLGQVENSFISCSTNIPVVEVKKLVAHDLLNDNYSMIDIYCGDELLQNNFLLKFVYLSFWKHKTGPLHLHYGSVRTRYA